MLIALLAGLAPLALSPAPAAPQDKPLSFAEAKQRFENLHKAGDQAGCVALWRANPHFALRVIDTDLEGSLKIRESSKTPDMAQITALQTRALWGASAAVEATGHAIFGDYTASFVGWNETQRTQFRTGQAVYKKAMDAFAAGDFAAAKTAGRECVEYAAPLGDWWGTAMGLEAQAMALQSEGALDDALHFYGLARLLNHDLLLLGDEYGDVRSIVDLCFSQERWSRGREAVDRALELGLKIGDTASQADLYEKRAQFEEKLGNKAGAEKSRAQAKALKK
jgi:tetratricopeptide (TPR) repeat protein